MGFLTTIMTVPGPPGQPGRARRHANFARQLVESAQQSGDTFFEKLNTRLDGLTAAEAEARLEQYGANVVAREKRLTFFARLWENVKNPLVILLVVLGLVSYLTGDLRATIVIGLMVLLGIVLRFVQETRADHAAEKLKAMVSTTATVIRDGPEDGNPAAARSCRATSCPCRPATWCRRTCAC